MERKEKKVAPRPKKKKLIKKSKKLSMLENIAKKVSGCLAIDITIDYEKIYKDTPCFSFDIEHLDAKVMLREFYIKLDEIHAVKMIHIETSDDIVWYSMYLLKNDEYLNLCHSNKSEQLLILNNTQLIIDKFLEELSINGISINR